MLQLSHCEANVCVAEQKCSAFYFKKNDKKFAWVKKVTYLCNVKLIPL